MPSQTIIRPNPGPQLDFVTTCADIAIYGGAAGGGKTTGMLLDPLKRRDVPDFDAMIFRRVGAQITLPGGLWTSSVKTYPQCGGTGFPGKKMWRWPNGFTVSFRHLEDDAALGAVQGSQIPYIGFDELTHFTRDQFIYLLSRNRSMTGIPGRIRATCNADSESWVKEFIRWWLDEEGRFPDRSKSMKRRWMVRDGDAFVWYGSKAEAEAGHGPDTASSVTFIPALLTDNPMLLKADPGYLAKLRGLGQVQRAQLEHGDWKARATAGMIFKRDWWRIEDAAPVMARVVRYWDRASSDVTNKNKDPDWTAGLKLGKDKHGGWWVMDVRRLRGTPATVEAAIESTARADGAGVECWLEHDPGQAGKAEASHYLRHFPHLGIHFNPVPRVGKVERAQLVSPQVEHGNCKLVRGEWNDAFIAECDAFPQGTHDDSVDALSGAYGVMAKGWTWNGNDVGSQSQPERSLEG